MANFLVVLPLYSYIIIAFFSIHIMTKHNFHHKNCIVAVILSHTHLSVCSVMLTLRASPRATPPSSPIPFISRLCLDNVKIQNFIPTIMYRSARDNVRSSDNFRPIYACDRLCAIMGGQNVRARDNTQN